MKPDSLPEAPPPIASPPDAWTLFREFARVGLSGFGGVLPFIRQAVVVRNRWLDDRAFAELLGIAQVLPGPNVVNIAVMLGYRHAGLGGAASAFAGLVLMPLLLLLGLTAVYYRFADQPAVRGALQGMMAVSAGLILATGLRLAASLPRKARTLIPLALATVAIGVLRLPLIPVVLVLVPASVAMEWWVTRQGAAAARSPGSSAPGSPSPGSSSPDPSPPRPSSADGPPPVPPR